MDDFIYSAEGLSAVRHFHNSVAVIYVEGDDDIVFWASIARVAGIGRCHIEAVGGSEQLEPYIERVVQDDAAIIVALDSDHSKFSDEHLSHERIVYTYGYSIENTMYCIEALDKMVKKLAKTRRSSATELAAWYQQFEDRAFPLLVYDVANYIGKKGILVFGANCCRFLVKSTSENLSTEKIKQFLTSIALLFDAEELEETRRRIAADGRPARYLIKGHFITHAALNEVKKMVRVLSGKRITLPVDNFYALVVDSCCNCLNACDATTSMARSLGLAVGSVS